MDENQKNDPEMPKKDLEKPKRDPEKQEKDLEKRKQDLEDVRKTESRRGRSPIDIEAHRKHQEEVRDMRKYLVLATEEEFLEAMRGFGLREGSPELSDALRIWRAYRG